LKGGLVSATPLFCSRRIRIGTFLRDGRFCRNSRLLIGVVQVSGLSPLQIA
jgi:hypothetical protein